MHFALGTAVQTRLAYQVVGPSSITRRCYTFHVVEVKVINAQKLVRGTESISAFSKVLQIECAFEPELCAAIIQQQKTYLLDRHLFLAQGILSLVKETIVASLALVACPKLNAQKCSSGNADAHQVLHHSGRQEAQ